MDSLVDGAIRFVFERMKNIPKSEVVASGLLALKQEQETRYRAAQRDYTNKAAELADLKGEVIKAIRGESKFTSDLLGELITQSEKSLAEIGVDRDAIKRKLDECENRIEEMQIRYDEVISWTDLYDTVDLSAKKMIVANLINRIEVGIDYQLHIDLNIDLSHFDIQLDFCTFGQGKTA